MACLSDPNLGELPRVPVVHGASMAMRRGGQRHPQSSVQASTPPEATAVSTTRQPPVRLQLLPRAPQHSPTYRVIKGLVAKLFSLEVWQLAAELCELVVTQEDRVSYKHLAESAAWDPAILPYVVELQRVSELDRCGSIVRVARALCDLLAEEIDRPVVTRVQWDSFRVERREHCRCRMLREVARRLPDHGWNTLHLLPRLSSDWIRKNELLVIVWNNDLAELKIIDRAVAVRIELVQ
jgi:hypothetical protein